MRFEEGIRECCGGRVDDFVEMVCGGGDCGFEKTVDEGEMSDEIG